MIIRRFLIKVFLIAMSACTLWAGAPLKDRAEVVFIDYTRKFNKKELSRWDTDFNNYTNSMRKPQRGVRQFHIRVLPIHRSTYSASPITDVQFPGRRGARYQRIRDVALDSVATSMKKLKKIIQEHPSLQNETEIFSAIVRAGSFFNHHKDALKKMVFYSDMIQWEKASLMLTVELTKTDGVESLVNTIIKQKNWSSDLLKEAQVRIVKPGTIAGDRYQSVAIAMKVDEFWKLLFQKLGATVESIETF